MKLIFVLTFFLGGLLERKGTSCAAKPSYSNTHHQNSCESDIIEGERWFSALTSRDLRSQFYIKIFSILFRLTHSRQSQDWSTSMYIPAPALVPPYKHNLSIINSLKYSLLALVLSCRSYQYKRSFWRLEGSWILHTFRYVKRRKSPINSWHSVAYL